MIVANLRIVHLESGDRLVKDVRCCHLWPVVIGEPIRRCGFCGEVPTDFLEDADRDA